MILYQPQVLLVSNSNNKYFLHATTFFNTINVKPTGFKVAKKVSKNGQLKVSLYAVKDASIPNGRKLQCITPVVHQVNLGNNISLDDDGNFHTPIKVTLYVAKLKTSRSSSGGGRNTGSTIIIRPTGGSGSRPNGD